MPKYVHEIRDPLHIFIRMDSDERKVLDSRPFQRLRYIHQLALTYLVYPGATHRRFEHSLGVMDLASRIFDVVTDPSNLRKDVSDILTDVSREDARSYWRRALRMAALCHDLGHLPFSHAAEKELLPEGWSHERITVEIIRSDEMRSIWDKMTPPLRAEDITKLAVGQKKLSEFEKDVSFTTWEAILAEIITGDAFGADRMDYLLRDSHHTGVAYGRFDHYRLIDSLRILPQRTDDGDLIEPVLGIDEGGIHSAEALLLARYFMYTQLYLHPVRRIYDIHLKDFLRSWLGADYLPTDTEGLLRLTDNEVTAEIASASRDAKHKGHESAKRIINHKHFKLLYKRNPVDASRNPDASKYVFEAACEMFDESAVRFDPYNENRKGGRAPPSFPVLKSDDRISWSREESDVIEQIPPIWLDYVFIAPEYINDAIKWRDANLGKIIELGAEEDNP
jgi:HD superfamily phosphohydrolase